MTEGNIQKQLVALTIPLLIGNLFQQFYNTVDSLVIGHYIGESAFAAVGVAGTVMNLFIFLVSGCCTGVSVILASLYGKNDLKQLRKELFLSSILGSIFTLVLSLLAIVFLPLILNMISTPLEIRGYISEYLHVIFLGLIVSFIYNLFSAMLRSAGNTRDTLIYLIIAMLCHLGLDILFVSTLHMGISGAGWATVISQLISALLCSLCIWKKYPEFIPHREDMRYDSHLVRQTISFASISALHDSSLYFGKMIVQGTVNQLGTAAIAAYTAAGRIEGIANSSADSGTDALSVFIAQNIGAGKKDRAKKGFTIGLQALIILGFISSAMLCITAKPFASLFISQDKGMTLNMASDYIRTIALFYGIDFFVSAFSGWFRGTGKLSIPFIGTTLQISVRILLSWLMAPRMGLNAISIATGIGWIILAFYQILESRKTNLFSQTETKIIIAQHVHNFHSIASHTFQLKRKASRTI